MAQKKKVYKVLKNGQLVESQVDNYFAFYIKTGLGVWTLILLEG